MWRGHVKHVVMVSISLAGGRYQPATGSPDEFSGSAAALRTRPPRACFQAILMKVRLRTFALLSIITLVPGKPLGPPTRQTEGYSEARYFRSTKRVAVVGCDEQLRAGRAGTSRGLAGRPRRRGAHVPQSDRRWGRHALPAAGHGRRSAGPARDQDPSSPG